MINKLVLVPTIVVVMLGPELSSSPLRLQVMVMGMSPWETAQVNWAKAPESTTPENENGAICGGSKRELVSKEWWSLSERSRKLCKIWRRHGSTTC